MRDPSRGPPLAAGQLSVAYWHPSIELVIVSTTLVYQRPIYRRHRAHFRADSRYIWVLFTTSSTIVPNVCRSDVELLLIAAPGAQLDAGANEQPE